MELSIDRADRDRIVSDLKQNDELSYGQYSDNLSDADFKGLGVRREQLLEEYFSILSDVTIARCPFTGTLAHKKMDLFGFDGPWWDRDFDDEFAKGGPHFLTYTGAMRLDNAMMATSTADTENRIELGPEVPYVIPRLLAREGECCVLYAMKMPELNATAFFTSYFAQSGARARDYHHAWLRGEFTVQEQGGPTTFEYSNDAWDFDIASWMSMPGKVYWIAPEDPEMRLRTETEDCPYLGLKGIEKMQVIDGGKLELEEPPSGRPIDKAGLFD